MKRLIIELGKEDFDRLVKYRDIINHELNLDLTVEQAAADCIIRKTKEYINKKEEGEWPNALIAANKVQYIAPALLMI
jgi:hypothetical protein